MKMIPCSYENCGKRRKHFTDQDSERGQVMIEVPDFVEEQFCSITCAIMAGKMTARNEPDNV